MGVSGLERNLTVVEVVNLMMIRRGVECTEILKVLSGNVIR